MHKHLLLAVMTMALCGPAAAHDFWVQPSTFRASPAAELAATLQVGHGAFRQRSPIPARRITGFRSLGPNGVIDQTRGLTPGLPDRDASLRFSGRGTYVVALETNNASTTLPAIRFNDYIKAEGLTPAIEWRRTTGASNDPGREIYSRRAKALVQVGSPRGEPAQPQVTTPSGLTLEIVPELNPYLLDPMLPFPVHVLYQDRPLAGALVKLTDLNADEQPVEMHETDTDGRAVFHVPHAGDWLLNVIWTEPIPANRTADFVTTFSSLSFGYGDDRG